MTRFFVWDIEEGPDLYAIQHAHDRWARSAAESTYEDEFIEDRYEFLRLIDHPSVATVDA